MQSEYNIIQKQIMDRIIQLSSQNYYQKRQQNSHLTNNYIDNNIQKFQQCLLTLPDTVITLDQRFLGGGIKMQDLIQQNSFIITQMRKFKAVFLNYCKLNDKIYKKIIEHQVNANEHYNKVLSISNNIDRKLEDADQELKKTKEKLEVQAFKLGETVEIGFKEVRADLGGKVAENGFSDKVKKIIEEYEQENASSSLPSDPQTRQQAPNDSNNPQSLSSVPQKKRRSGLTQQDIQAFKSQITPMIDSLSQQLALQSTHITQLTSSQFSHSIKIKKVQKQCQQFNEEIMGIRKSIDQMKVWVKGQDEKIVGLLRDTINEGVWMRKLEEFREKVVVPGLEGITGRVYGMVEGVRKEIQVDVKPKFADINTKIIRQTQKHKSLQSLLHKQDQKHNQHTTKLTTLKSQLQSQLESLSTSFHTITTENTTTLHSQYSQLSQTQHNLSTTINSLISITQQSVLKKVQQKLGKQMKDIRNDIGSLNKKTSQICMNVKFNVEQVDHVKDVVAKKANFTDLVQYFDRKADKEEFRELVEMVESPRGWATVGDQARNSENRLGDSRKRRRRSSYSRGGLTTPMYTKQQQPHHKQSPQSKQLLKNIIKTNTLAHTTTAKIKTKSMRPSTANTLFML